MNFETVPLMQYLKNHEIYYGKVLELREEIQGWLNYIPETFPHYTRHTIEHSESIILQISKFLFHDDDAEKSVINLSGVEAYILIAAAYLHDAGMVTSNKEKETILTEAEWKRWTGPDGEAHKRWNEIKDFREGNKPEDNSVRNFISDLQTRFLIAEYVRRVHHERAADVISQHQSSLGRIAFDDGDLQTAISEVCVAHGLSRTALDDKVRFPLRRQIRDEDVNLRLLAIILRLGDLLDLQNSRACPLLLNAACPIPAESFAHWTQYERIKHRAVSPDNIEIRAECETPEEHRLLRDWCQWIVDEISNVPNLLAGGNRHSNWTPPIASMTGDNPTIVIDPSPKATYRARDWRFELDETSVFNLLISEVYGDKWVFIRELIQNALDAMRCQMYEDLVAEGGLPPLSPTKVSEKIRDRYRLKIAIFEDDLFNDNTNEVEKRQIFTIEDSGIGMDDEIISSHFLQVGRSYYTTDIFRNRYAFTPTSQFGVGFLSVFGASEHVIVETYKPSSLDKETPIRLILKGPRNYIIVEEGRRKTAGTKINVRLNTDLRLKEGQLTNILRDWCKNVEFPVEVNDFGDLTNIRVENLDDSSFKIPDASNPGSNFELLKFSIDEGGIEGALFILAHRNKKGVETWNHVRWYTNEYPKKHPEINYQPLPKGFISYHGIASSPEFSPRFGENVRMKLDIRGRDFRPSVSRHHLRAVSPYHNNDFLPQIVIQKLMDAVKSHLNSSSLLKDKYGWEYLQKIIDSFPTLGSELINL
ncbi:MAG: ATP-binding protein [Proteobacteria bacterium]|nr:ATP-binding protein [Pseudomonadota bacterium]